MGLTLEPTKVVSCQAHPRTHQGGVLCSTWGTRLLRHVLPNHSQASHQWCFASKAAPDFFHVPPDCSCTTPLPLQAVSVQPTPLLFLSPLKPKFHPSVPATHLSPCLCFHQKIKSPLYNCKLCHTPASDTVVSRYSSF